MNRKDLGYVFGRTIYLCLSTLLSAILLVRPADSRRWSPQDGPRSLLVRSFGSGQFDGSDEKSNASSGIAIPSGTILPVRLNSTVSSAKSKPGKMITARIMQDVPLSPAARIREGSRVVGHIVEVTPATTGVGARISLQFDKLVSAHQTISITTNLRAIAGFMRILEAQTPPIGPGETDVYRWLTTVQVGGDVVYGEGGVVTAADNPNDVVGKSVDGGVLGQIRAKEGTECRGVIDGNDSPQALWVFSSDACGTYGLEHISIAHAGRTDPLGVIVLTSNKGNLKIPAGAGLLLRVTASHVRGN